MRKETIKEETKRLRIIVPALLICMTLSEGAKSGNKTITEILQEYCVPASINYCSEKATYTNGKCECSKDGMYYDKTSRICKECEIGTYAKSRSATSCEEIKCPAGTIREVVTACPSGYVKSVYPE